MYNIKQFLKQNPIFSITTVWLIINIFWLLVFGIHTELEGEKYTIQADYFLKNGNFTEARHIFYVTTILIIGFSKLLTGHLWLAFIILWFINWLAYVSFFKAISKWIQSETEALIICSCLLLFFPFQMWTNYLYTENIFYSLVLLFISKLIALQANHLNLKNYLSLILVLILLIISRPFGILFAIPAMLYCFLIETKSKKFIVIVIGFMFLFLFQYISKIVFTTTPDWTVQRSFIEENLICDVPTNLSKKHELTLINTGNPLQELLYYITHNFSHFTKLAFLRLKLFFINTRTYYSFWHNGLLLAVFIPLYLLIILKIKQVYKLAGKAFFSFTISIVAIFAAAVATQCDDYHNRFFMTLMPIWIILCWLSIRNYFFLKTQ
jgi:hypothetical protein